MNFLKAFFQPQKIEVDFSKIQRLPAPAYLRAGGQKRQAETAMPQENLIPIASATQKNGDVAQVFQRNKSVTDTGMVIWDLTNTSPDKAERSDVLTRDDLKNLLDAKLSAITGAKLKPYWAARTEYKEVARKTGLALNSVKAYFRVFGMGGRGVDALTLFAE